jgi:hypothetical protein
MKQKVESANLQRSMQQFYQKSPEDVDNDDLGEDFEL